MNNYYIADLLDFLKELSANNNRQWFAENRDRYDHLRALWLNDLDRLIAHMSEWEPRLIGQTGKSSVYRIYRDTRFSPDKRPLKDYFSAAFSPWGRKTSRASYYIELGISDAHQSGFYGGLYCPDTPLLNKMRHAIVDNIEEFSEIINNPDLNREFPGWVGNILKTVPKGWERNHPLAPLLRLKDYGKFHPCSNDFFLKDDWPERASELMRLLKPLVDFLNYTIDE